MKCQNCNKVMVPYKSSGVVRTLIEYKCTTCGEIQSEFNEKQSGVNNQTPIVELDKVTEGLLTWRKPQSDDVMVEVEIKMINGLPKRFKSFEEFKSFTEELFQDYTIIDIKETTNPQQNITVKLTNQPRNLSCASS